MLRRILPATLVALATLLISACDAGDADSPVLPSTSTSTTAPTTTTGSPTTTTPPNSTGGFGTPAQAPGEFDHFGGGAGLRADLRLAANGCWYADINGAARLAVFPVGFEIPFSSDPTVLMSPDGNTFASGALVDGVGRVLFADDLPGGTAGLWSNYAAFCGETGAEVVVFDEIRPGFDPAALDEARLVEMVTAAVFTEHWRCGRGWAISTPDERVAIYIYQQGEDALSSGTTIELPDPDWRAEVVVGEFLFVNHCDDVFESWEPAAIFAARWQIAAGTVEIIDDFPMGFDPGSVRAELAGAEAVTPSGTRVELPGLELINTGFNFFAG